MYHSMHDFVTWAILGSLLLFAPLSSTAPVSHESGGDEHIVILDKSRPTAPRVAEVLKRLDLHEHHADVHYVFNNSAFIGFVCQLQQNIIAVSSRRI